MMRKSFILLSLMMSYGLFAQLTKSNAKFLNQPEGDEIIVLNDSTSISLGRVENGFYSASKIGLVHQDYFNKEDSTIFAGAILYNADKKEIGEILIETKVVETRPSDILRWKKYVWVRFEGAVSNKRIYYKSLPEKKLESLLQEKASGNLYNRLQPFFKTYEFDKDEEEGFSVYTYWDHDITTEKEKPYRLIVIFRGESVLYCVITGGAKFDLPKMKDQRENGAGTYYFSQKPTERIFETITDMVYSRIPL